MYVCVYVYTYIWLFVFNMYIYILMNLSPSPLILWEKLQNIIKIPISTIKISIRYTSCTTITMYSAQHFARTHSPQTQAESITSLCSHFAENRFTLCACVCVCMCINLFLHINILKEFFNFNIFLLLLYAITNFSTNNYSL